jgi:hypothetical protein
MSIRMGFFRQYEISKREISWKKDVLTNKQKLLHTQ